MTRRIAGRGGCAVVLVSGLLVALASPAAAKWSGALSRADSDPSSGALVLTLTASASTFDLHFGLGQPGYSVSNVSADAPGPGGSNACTPTPASGLTTGNAGIDCTFGNAVQAVTVTFSTSPRYPDGGGGEAYDGGDSSVNPVAGPGGASPPPPVPPPPTTMVKLTAQIDALNAYERASDDCYAKNSTENLPSLGIYKAILTNILEDRQECLDLAEKILQQARAKVDPPDQDFTAVAVPAIPAARGLGPARCPRAATKRAVRLCSALRPLVLRRDASSARVAGIWGAMVTTLNRLSTAVAASHGSGIAIQGAALRALEADLLVASAAQDHANAGLAAVLRKQHVSVTMSRKNVAAAERNLRAGHLPSWALKALAKRGISAASLRAALAAIPPPKPRAVKLTTLLEAKTIGGSTASGLAAEAAQGSAQDLANLATGLQNAGVIDQALHDTLISDANAISQSSTPSARASAVAKFVSDAARAPSEAAALLTAAAQAFTG